MTGNPPPPVSCHALLISAPASGQGKTLTTCLLTRHYQRLGLTVCLFKCGPDFLDPMVLEQASGVPVYQLDLWMMGDAHCQQLLYQAASRYDVILVEGMMGLFDGTHPSAHIAARFNLPVLAVIDGSAMAETFGALCLGLDQYRSDVHVYAAVANRVRSDKHYAMLRHSLPNSIQGWGFIPPAEPNILPERHLGIVPPDQVNAFQHHVDTALHLWQEKPTALPPMVQFEAPENTNVPILLHQTIIAVARDDAFCFLYRANLETLERLGATLTYFSPLTDASLPECDAVYLPGGYPELYLKTLANNDPIKTALRNHHQSGKPLVAECGGLLYLMNTLSYQGQSSPMLGILPGHGQVGEQLQAIAMQRLNWHQQALHGHSFHYGHIESSLAPITHAQNPNGDHMHEPVYQVGRTLASFVHFYFASNPRVCANWFRP